MPANGIHTNPLGLTKPCPLCGSQLGSNRATFCSPRCYLKGWGAPQENGCVLWEGPVGNHGYGNFAVDNVRYTTHRAAYATFIGSIPRGMMICHKCDVKTCINPDHLYVGTSLQNRHDAINRRRDKRKLTDDEVRQIRSVSGVPRMHLAKYYGVTDTLIRFIQEGKAWRHLLAE